ncbi:MAG: hypothetical protein IJV14_10765 [Lachnospiraceae bacterium]|nr:hypothetical protein [Lachnospiraceae bacterium]
MVNEEGLMDHWQDQTMTIRAIDVSYGGPWYRMVEDGEENGGEGWYWKDSMIDCLEEQESDFDGDEFESAIL